MLRNLFLAGAKNLEAKKEYVNELNVFPVPDGDTGTNMTLTIMSAAREVASLPENAELKDLCKAMSSGSLRGARGNSGVILSQLFRGMCKVLKNIDTDEITIEDIIASFDKAVESAYKAVMKPTEGTILTVSKGVYEKAAEFDNNSDMAEFIDAIIVHAQEVLDQTPEMLPVLKQAGVVDSGGAGLLEVLKGAQRFYRGEQMDLTIPDETSASAGEDESEASAKAAAKQKPQSKYTYDMAYTIALERNFNIKQEQDFLKYLESMGDHASIRVEDNDAKMTVHTDDPGLVLQRALSFGALFDISIENLRHENKAESANLKQAEEKNTAPAKEETQSAAVDPAEWKDFGFITISVGEGISEIFKDLNVDKIISGGQTMNPSTDDILKAIEQIPAKVIYVFPNNKNIIMAANQARDLTKDKKVVVVPSKTVPQGIAAIINFMPDLSGAENLATMTEAMGMVQTGQVTYAVRDTEIDDKVIKENDIMGIGDKGILAVGQDITQTATEMVDEMMKNGGELISIYYGQDIEEADAEKLADALRGKYGDCDIELVSGGQPIYYYMISVE
ncbi:MAG: DAK2 domain-containing protein [Lachnospiraceae bacterium]|nr:DAK2 domain-containing protein [Lachnospiraceae bacterium]